MLRAVLVALLQHDVESMQKRFNRTLPGLQGILPIRRDWTNLDLVWWVPGVVVVEIDIKIVFKRLLGRFIDMQAWRDMGHLQGEGTNLIWHMFSIVLVG